MNTATLHLALVSLLVVLTAACGDGTSTTKAPESRGDAGVADDAGADADDACPGGELSPGVCAPEPPRSATASDCPGERFGPACLPEPPRAASDGECPAGRDSDGICVPATVAFETWACPVGWQSFEAHGSFDGGGVTDDAAPAFVACRPSTPASDCPTGTMPELGSDGCRPQGGICPAAGERWHVEGAIRARAPDHPGGIVYVQPGASASGNGSRVSPYPSINQAIANAQVGGVIALATGDYGENFGIDKDLAVVGACVAQTRVFAPADSDTSPTSFVAGGSVRLADFTVAGRNGVHGPGLVVVGGTAHSFEALRVEQARDVGVLVGEGSGTTEMRDIVVTDTLPPVGTNSRGQGVIVRRGASLQASGLALIRNRSAGLFVTDAGTVATIEGLSVTDTQPRKDGTNGVGVLVQETATLNLSRAALWENPVSGVAVNGTSSTAALTDVWIAETRGQTGDDSGGFAVFVEEGGAVNARRLVVEGSLNAAAHAYGAGTTVALRQFALLDTAAGRGIQAEDGAVVTAEQGAMVRSVAGAVGASDPGTLVTLSDVIIAGVRADGTGPVFEAGLAVADSASITAERALIHDGVGSGAVAARSGSITLTDVRVLDHGNTTDDVPSAGILGLGGQLTANRVAVRRSAGSGVALSDAATFDGLDLVVSDSLPNLDGNFGRAMDVEFSSQLTARRVSLRRCRQTGAFVTASASLSLTDFVIADMQENASDLDSGRGMYGEEAATIELTRGRFENNRESGLFVVGDGTTATLTDVTVAATLPTLGTIPGGGGLLVEFGAHLTGRRVHTMSTNYTGVLVALEGSRAEFDDLIIEHASPDPAIGGGTGLAVFLAGHVEVRRGAILGGSEAAIAILQDGSGDLSDIEVSAGRNASGESSARGIIVQQGGALDVTRGSVHDNYEVAVFVVDAGVATLTDVTIAGTLEAVCGEHCAVGPIGTGIIVSNASLGLHRFVTTDHALAGLQIIHSDLTASDGAITGNVIGVNVQSPDLNIDEAFENVVSFDNDVDFESKALLAPSLAELLDQIAPDQQQDREPQGK